PTRRSSDLFKSSRPDHNFRKRKRLPKMASRFFLTFESTFVRSCTCHSSIYSIKFYIAQHGVAVFEARDLSGSIAAKTDDRHGQLECVGLNRPEWGRGPRRSSSIPTNKRVYGGEIKMCNV